jgi:hypothetical protein
LVQRREALGYRICRKNRAETSRRGIMLVNFTDQARKGVKNVPSARPLMPSGLALAARYVVPARELEIGAACAVQCVVLSG